MLSGRIQRLKDRAMADGGAARGEAGYRAYAQMLASTTYHAETIAQQRAFMLKALAEEMPLSITPDEVLVGEHLFSEVTEALDFWGWNDAAQQQLAAANFDETTKAEIAAYLQAESTHSQAPLCFVGKSRPVSASEGWDKGVFWANGCIVNHSIRDFSKVVEVGFSGILAEVDAARAACPITAPEFSTKAAFWRAAEAVCEAGITLGRRYAETAEKLLDQCTDEARASQLQTIIQTCRRIPEFGARTLHEAVQAVWFVHILTCAEDHINANSIGRLDQILHPYYKADLEAGCTEYAGAVELMAELACKLYRDYDVQQICLSGSAPDGSDCTNDITYAILDATEALGFIRCISVRLHRNSPQRLLRQCGRMLLKGGGIPFFFNDHALTAALARGGITPEDAFDYATIGCVEVTIPGKATPHAVSGALNAAKVLELTLNNGKDIRSGEQLGPQTGFLQDHPTFEDLYAAYRKNVELFTQHIVQGCNQGQLYQTEREPLPLFSVLTDNCIARGKDLNAGGALYNYHSIMLYGVPNVADSLWAIKHTIYDEKCIDPGELLEALRSNFDGQEPLRQQLLGLPKYGNDRDEVDALAAEVAEHFCDYLSRFSAPFDGFFAAQLFTYLWHIDFGRTTSATPDGRRAGEPLAYSLSPQQGRDRNSLTAMMKSLAKIPHHKAGGSSSAIIEIDSSNLGDNHGQELMASIIRSGIEMGIGQMQFNLTTAERLLKAQQDPEKYGNVQVRVSGYSSKFCLLNKDLQDHIIARVKH